MRILYNNLLESASNSATNADANYPIGNVVDTTLLTEFRATTNSTVVTCTLDEASTISTYAFGNHNIDTLTITLTHSGGPTAYNYTAADLRFSAEITQKMIYETAVAAVTEIEYDITSVDALYIGGLSAGQSLDIDYFDIIPDLPLADTSEADKSRGGVLYGSPGVVLDGFGCVFNGGSITEYNAINAFKRLVQKYKPYWVDRWEDSDIMPVLFANNTSNVSWNKGPEGIIFDSFRLELEECK